MDPRGRVPTPAALRVVKPGERAPVEPGRALGEPEMPEGLSPGAIAEWHRIVPTLVRLGLLARVEDAAPLAAYCTAAALYLEASRVIEREGMGSVAGVRATSQLLRLSAELRAWAARFGLTPSDRMRVEVKLQPGPVEDADDYLKKKMEG